MADLSVSVSIALVAAVILGEVFSTLWYADGMPWGRYTDQRYFVSSIVADIGLALLVQYTMKRFYSVHSWEDAMMLAGCLALIYACLEAPHAVHNHRSFSRFLFHVIHKFGIIFVMAMALVFFEKY